MLRVIGRLSLIVWSGVAVLVILAGGLGRLQQRDVFVYSAYVDDNPRATDVSLYDLQSGLAVVLFQRIDLLSMDVAADGRFLLLEQRLRRGHELQIAYLANGAVDAIHQGDFDMARGSPDGQWVAFRRTSLFDSGIYRLPVRGGEPEKIAPPRSIYALAADNRAVYYSAWGTNDTPGIISRDIASGQTTTRLEEPLLYITDMTTHDDQIAFIGNHAPSYFDTSTGEAHPLQSEVGVAASITWSLTGDRIAVVTGYTQTSSAIIPNTPGVIILDLDGNIVGEFSPPNQNYNRRIGWVTMR